MIGNGLAILAKMDRYRQICQLYFSQHSGLGTQHFYSFTAAITAAVLFTAAAATHSNSALAKS